MKPGELKRTTELKRGTRGLTRTAFTRRKTKKLRAYDAEFAAVRPVIMMRANGMCEALDWFNKAASNNPRWADGGALRGLLEDGCGGEAPATHVHHRKYRSRGGSNRVVNLVALCEKCHRWCHAYPKQSWCIGLSVYASESEDL